MLLRQCGNVEKGSCGSGRCCGSVEIQERLLRERALLRQCRSIEKGSCGSRHCSGSGEEFLKTGNVYGGSEDRVNGDKLELKGLADENSVSFFDMEVVSM
ncbi:hypothetical protein ROHU_002239 [Labeo rohita]|uniref:Uncharacterized protein n=1 Tax=Labeo rohita TaxID=84645 RepID=A0A498NY51_LABRO|nr:hypothetical protein ROHU_002239 [Labeo rohita]